METYNAAPILQAGVSYFIVFAKTSYPTGDGSTVEHIKAHVGTRADRALEQLNEWAGEDENTTVQLIRFSLPEGAPLFWRNNMFELFKAQQAIETSFKKALK